MTKIYRPLP